MLGAATRSTVLAGRSGVARSNNRLGEASPPTARHPPGSAASPPSSRSIPRTRHARRHASTSRAVAVILLRSQPPIATGPPNSTPSRALVTTGRDSPDAPPAS